MYGVYLRKIKFLAPSIGVILVYLAAQAAHGQVKREKTVQTTENGDKDKVWIEQLLFDDDDHYDFYKDLSPDFSGEGVSIPLVRDYGNNKRGCMAFLKSYSIHDAYKIPDSFGGDRNASVYTLMLQTHLAASIQGLGLNNLRIIKAQKVPGALFRKPNDTEGRSYARYYERFFSMNELGVSERHTKVHQALLSG